MFDVDEFESGNATALMLNHCWKQLAYHWGEGSLVYKNISYFVCHSFLYNTMNKLISNMVSLHFLSKECQTERWFIFVHNKDMPAMDRKEPLYSIAWSIMAVSSPDFHWHHRRYFDDFWWFSISMVIEEHCVVAGRGTNNTILSDGIAVISYIYIIKECQKRIMLFSCFGSSFSSFNNSASTMRDSVLNGLSAPSLNQMSSTNSFLLVYSMKLPRMTLIMKYLDRLLRGRHSEF